MYIDLLKHTKMHENKHSHARIYTHHAEIKRNYQFKLTAKFVPQKCLWLSF